MNEWNARMEAFTPAEGAPSRDSDPSWHRKQDAAETSSVGQGAAGWAGRWLGARIAYPRFHLDGYRLIKN